LDVLAFLSQVHFLWNIPKMIICTTQQ
jgi:hypothetical protein